MLPQSPNLAWSLSFWLALNLVAALLGAATIGTLASPWWSLLVLIVSSGIAMVGLLKPGVIGRPYRAWNAAATAYVRHIRSWILAVSYFVIVLSAPRVESTRNVTRIADDGSFWELKSPAGIESCTSGAARGRRWITHYLSWSRQSGNLWAVCLLPFIALLQMLEQDEEQNRLPERLYTLY